MEDAFMGEIRLFAGKFAPRGWAFCNGQELPIQSNAALYSILGLTYGGDGKTRFKLPDLRDHFPMHAGSGQGLTHRRLGERVGATSVKLSEPEMPVHSHTAHASPGPTQFPSPVEAIWAGNARLDKAGYGPNPDVSMADTALAPAGGEAAHNNWQPYLGLHFIICLDGYFPPRD